MTTPESEWLRKALRRNREASMLRDMLQGGRNEHRRFDSHITELVVLGFVLALLVAAWFQ